MSRKVLISTIVITGLIILVALKLLQGVSSNNKSKNMKLSSSVFANNQKLPEKYTCKGEGISPPLEIYDVPKGAQSLALILKDPDAPMSTFIHWLVWNISPNTRSLFENTLPTGSTEGTNSAGQNHYFNPCPPSGQHRYIFYLYALDTTLTLPPEATVSDFEQITQGHILEETTLTGIYP